MKSLFEKMIGIKVLTGLSSQKKELVIVPDGGHNFQFFMGCENYIAKIVEFCDATG